mgnify:CR=1 FL=1
MDAFDELWPGGPRFLQYKDSFRLSTDSVLLAGFVRIKKNARCLDLGCGAGVLPVLLAAREATLELTGVELQPDAAALTFQGRVTIDVEEQRAKGRCRTSPSTPSIFVMTRSSHVGTVHS